MGGLFFYDSSISDFKPNSLWSTVIPTSTTWTKIWPQSGSILFKKCNRGKSKAHEGKAQRHQRSVNYYWERKTSCLLVLDVSSHVIQSDVSYTGDLNVHLHMRSHMGGPHFSFWDMDRSVCVFHWIYCWSVRRCWRLMFMMTPGEDEVPLVVTHMDNSIWILSWWSVYSFEGSEMLDDYKFTIKHGSLQYLILIGQL